MADPRPDTHTERRRLKVIQKLAEDKKQSHANKTIHLVLYTRRKDGLIFCSTQHCIKGLVRSNLNLLYIKWLYTGGLRAAADESEITAYLFAKQKSIKRSISALSLHQLSKIIKKATLEGSYLYPSCQLISYSR